MPTINGMWKWIGTASSSGNEYWNHPINFSSNGMTFSSLRIEAYAIPTYVEISYDNYKVQSCDMKDPEDANGDEDYEVVATLREEYRIMDFGETEQYIDDELYNFIRRNAKRLSKIAEKLVTIAENEQKIYDTGKQAEYDAFWDTFQNYGSESGMSYNEVFGKGRFTDVNYNPKYPIQVVVGTNSGYAMFNGASKITDIKVPIYHRGTNLGYLFNSCGMLKRIPALHILAEVTSFQAAFEGCNALEDITIAGTIGQNIDFKSSTKLTRASIESIVNALSDSVVGKTLTLSRAAVDEAFRYISGMTNDQGVFEELINIKGSECWMWTEFIAPKIEGNKWIIDLV